MVWLYISIIMVMRVVQSVFSKKNSDTLHKNAVCYVKYTVFYQVIACACALVLFLVELMAGVSVSNVGATFFYASITGVALALSCIIGVYLLTNGTMALASLFGTAGLIVPTIVSIFLYGEAVVWYQWLALVVFMVGAYFLSMGSKNVYGKFSLVQFIVLVIYLLTNGTSMLMQKMFGEEVKGGNVSLFSFLSFLSGLVLLLIFWLAIELLKKRLSVAPAKDQEFTLYPTNADQAKFPKKGYVYGLFLAFAVFVINQFITISTPMIEAVVLFAITCGGATVISAIVGATIYREKITWNTLLGLVLGIGALVLLKV